MSRSMSIIAERARTCRSEFTSRMRRDAAHPRLHQGAVLAQQVEVARTHAELILGAALRRGDVDRLGGLEIDVDARHGRRRPTQSGNDLLGAVRALRLVAQHDEDAPGIHRGRRIATADRRHDRDHVGVAPDDLGQRRLAGHHRVEGRVVRPDRGALDLPDILRGEEALRNRLEEQRGDDEGAEGDRQHQPGIADRVPQRPAIAAW